MKYSKDCREPKSRIELNSVDQSRSFLEWTLLVTILIVNGLFLSFNAFRGFNFYDMGSFLDASWRVYIGQIPYIDFIFHPGPVHIYLNAFLFHLFGFGKTAMLAHLITVHSIVIVLTFFIARRFTRFWTAALATLLTTTCFYWPTSHPWHNQTAHLWGFLSIAAILFNVQTQNQHRVFLASVLAGILCGISAMTKINLGTAYFLIILSVLLFSDRREISIPSFLTGTAMSMGIVLALLRGRTLFLEQALSYYSQISKQRIPELFNLGSWFNNHYWVFVVFVLVNVLQHAKLLREFSFRQNFILVLGFFFIGVVATQTDGSFKPANISLWGIILSFTYTVIMKTRHACTIASHRLLHYASIILVTVFCLFLIGRSTWCGIKLLRWTYIRRSAIGNYSIKSEPLQGWLCRDKEGKALDEMVSFIKENIPKSETLLVLSDMQILYPLTGRDSYRGVTFNFYVGEFGLFPTPGKQRGQVTENILKNPPDWIITLDRNLEYEMPTVFVVDLIPYLGLTEFLASQYVTVHQVGPYQILKRKNL